MTDRQTGSLGAMVDLAVVTTVSYPLARTVSQAVSVSSIYLVCVPRQYAQLETLNYAQLEALNYGQLEILCTPGSSPLSATQAQSVTLISHRIVARLVSLTQAQSSSLATNRLFARVVNATQAQSVRSSRIYNLLLTLTTTTVVSLQRQFTQILSVNSPTSPRLVRQIFLTRSLSQATSARITGLPVKLTLITVSQTRSLALGRAISLMRTLQQGTVSLLRQLLQLAPSVTVSTILNRTQALMLTRATTQAMAVSLQTSNVTPRYFLTLSLSQGQLISLGRASTGVPARVFQVCPSRTIIFPMCQRAAHFQAPRRGVRFTVEVR